VPDPTSGRSLVTRRALRDLVRTTVLGVYGVTGFAGAPLSRFLARLGFAQPGIRLHVDAELAVDLDLMVAYGLPVAEVARQVEASVRYALHRALGREVGRVTIHVAGLRYEPGQPPSPNPAPAGPGPAELAASGSDVA